MRNRLTENIFAKHDRQRCCDSHPYTRWAMPFHVAWCPRCKRNATNGIPTCNALTEITTINRWWLNTQFHESEAFLNQYQGWGKNSFHPFNVDPTKRYAAVSGPCRHSTEPNQSSSQCRSYNKILAYRKNTDDTVHSIHMRLKRVHTNVHKSTRNKILGRTTVTESIPSSTCGLALLKNVGWRTFSSTGSGSHPAHL